MTCFYFPIQQVTKTWLHHRARPLLFSTALPPAATAAAIESVKMLMESTKFTDKLWTNAKYFKEGLNKLGFDTGNSETPITPVMIGGEAETMKFSKALLDAGVYVSGIVFPTVALGKGRLRCMLSASHTQEDLDFAIKTFEKVGKELGII